MKRTKLYFDTSIFNFAIAEDVPNEKQVTLKLLDEVRKGSHEVFISEVVIRELTQAPQDKAIRLIELVNQLHLKELPLDDESRALAEKYITTGIIPAKYRDDAYHIAVTSVNNLDAIISWNFSHIVKLKTKREVVGINALVGYKEIEIYSPWEVVTNV